MFDLAAMPPGWAEGALGWAIVGGGKIVVLGEVLADPAVLLAVCEHLAPSMNGRAAWRLALVLDSIRLDPSGDLLDEADREWLTSALSHNVDERVGRWRSAVNRLAADGVSVISCADDDYPQNLAMVYDRPPVLFVRGSLTASDAWSVAVVGTRQPSPAGVRLATKVTTELAETGVTIVSGLARGIDTAAHAAALNTGGRTIAVFGTTIDTVYPATNRALARSIARSGACVSQFLPGSSTRPWFFPVRNVTASGMSLGTIVVEAGETSGARLQAQAAIAQGKKVFLVEQLVTRQPWAKEMADREPLVTMAGDVDSILQAVDAELATPTELLL